MCKWELSAFLLFGLFFHVFGTIIIKELSGADKAQYGSNNTLKCEFLFKDETGVEVKWFYNDNMQIVSWIPTKNKPQAIGHFKSILDFADDNDTMKSTIRFKDLTFDLSGRYTCKVSGNENEQSETQNMVVYQPASLVEFVEEGDAESITCSAYDLFPMPNITITGSYTTGRDDPIPIIQEFDNITITDDNYYNISKVILLDKSSLNRTVVFTCNIFIPETAFNEKLNITIEIQSHETTTEYTDIYESTTSTEYIDSPTINSATLSPSKKGNFATASTIPSIFLLLTSAILLYLNSRL
ncbi:hypothetical protein RN001_014403 [Aquatica leii]|uniref:Ig-like domain-containing protein n=1 Tax=Aquatica leii TaxID=1421715 RepID=A0AAN7PNE0_9COLE|nr:hypothetical protein RN001_014403 [Aquatica leii]